MQVNIPLVSVVLPVYNGTNLVEAIESILNQTFKDFEFIIVNDGSPDNSLDIIKLYEKIDGRIIIINRENKGLIYSLNEGIEKARGTFIARMDHDDIAMSTRFEEQIKFLENNDDIDVVGTYIEEIDEYGNILREVVKFPNTHEDCIEFFKKRVPFVHPSVMLRRSFFDKTGLYSAEIQHEEDTLLWYRGFINGCKYANIPIVGLKYRRTNDFYERRANLIKSFQLLRYRVFKINRTMKYGLSSDLYAVLYFILMLSPRIIKKIAYKIFR